MTIRYKVTSLNLDKLRCAPIVHREISNESGRSRVEGHCELGEINPMEAMLVKIWEVVVSLIQQHIVYQIGVSSTKGEESRKGDGMKKAGDDAMPTWPSWFLSYGSYGSTATLGSFHKILK